MAKHDKELKELLWAVPGSYAAFVQGNFAVAKSDGIEEQLIAYLKANKDVSLSEINREVNWISRLINANDIHRRIIKKMDYDPEQLDEIADIVDGFQLHEEIADFIDNEDNWENAGDVLRFAQEEVQRRKQSPKP